MEKVRYMISDAAALAGVETHVLRYWEEELDLTIPRNEMGHRYYTRENIQEFQRIKELKENGYQLKDLRGLIAPEAIPSISICKGDITVINTAIRNPRQGSSTIFAYIRPDCSVYFAAGREPTREDLPLGKLIALVRRC